MPVTVNAEVTDMTWQQAMVYLRKIVEDCERKCNSGPASKVREHMITHLPQIAVNLELQAVMNAEIKELVDMNLEVTRAVLLSTLSAADQNDTPERVWFRVRVAARNISGDASKILQNQKAYVLLLVTIRDFYDRVGMPQDIRKVTLELVVSAAAKQTRYLLQRFDPAAAAATSPSRASEPRGEGGSAAGVEPQ